MTILDQICDIQLGHTAKARLDPAELGVSAIQLRDTRPEGGVAVHGVGRYRMEPIPERYWTRSGDVLFRSRGDKNTATALGAEFNEPAVAVMPLVILRPRGDRIDPRYLAWCINQPAAQRHFDECARGTSIRMIPIGCLSSLEIPLPELVEQRAIAEVAQLSQLEHDLATRLAERRRQLTAFALHERAARNSLHQQGASREAATRSGKQRE